MTPDSLKWLIDYAIAAYESELRNTEKIKDRISFVLSIAITPFSGVLVYLAVNFKGKLLFSISNTLFFWAPWIIAAITLCISIGFLAYALLRGFFYARVPLPSEILPYFEQHPEPDKALEEGQDYLLKEYTESVKHNFQQNQKRYRLLLWSQRGAFLTLVFIIFCLPWWLHNAIQHTPEPQSIRIVSRIETTKEKSMSESNTQSSGAIPTSQTQVKPQAQQKTRTQEPSSATPSTTVLQARPPFPKRVMVLDSVDRSDTIT